MFRTGAPHPCTYCRARATEYRLYGPGEDCRANRAVPTCGTITAETGAKPL